MRPDRRTLRSHLERMGRAPVPPPAPGFVARTEERLRSLRHVAVVDEPAWPADRRRPRLAVAAAAAFAVAAMFLALPDDRRVSLTTEGGTTTTTPPVTPAPTVVEPPPTTVAPPPVLPPATVVTTTTAAPAVAPRPHATTTTAAPAPTVVPTTVPAPVTTTTTKPPAIARLELRCVAGTEAGAPVVTCTWNGVSDPAFAGWRLHRAAGTSAKEVVWTSRDPSALTYADHGVVPATTYQYAVEAFAADGHTLAKGGIVSVGCCPP